MEENSFFPFAMKELPEKFMKKAKVELGETLENREKCITELRKRILDEKGLICRTDDEFLIMFLRPRKYNIDRAFNTVKKLFEMKTELLFFRRLENINSFYDILEKRVTTFLQHRDSEGRAVFIFKLRNWIPEEESVDSLIAVIIGLIYSALDFPMMQVNGVVAIIDLKDANFNHLTHLTPYIQLIMHGVQDCAPIRLKAVHFVNGFVLVKYIWMIFKPFLSKKLKQRFLFHGKNIESLHRFIPRSILPSEYGGTLDASDVAENCRETKYGERFFNDLINSGYIEEEQKLRAKLKK